MADLIRHRGPDEQGLHLDGPAALAHLRLSIIDLGGGHQPLANEDESVWIVFNGEIYNFEELREPLAKKGHIFRTRSDTEIIVHLYEEYGEDCVQHLRGMFAFAIWDRPRQRLFLARDRFGKKPLYCATHDNGFWFASELKCFLKVPGFARRLNREALDGFLSYRYVPGPETIFEGVYKLQPGHTLTVSQDGRCVTRRYWEPPTALLQPAPSDDEALERLKQLLDESVRLRTISEVPLGAFLSGGLDSSLVVGLLSKHSSEPVKTFSVGFPGHGQLNEMVFARQVSKHFGTDHHELALTPQDVRDSFAKVVWHLDEPLADAAAVPTLLLSQLARTKVTVALTGEGADEIFAGYPRYYWEHQLRLLEPWFPRLPARVLAGVFWRFKVRRYAKGFGLLSKTRSERHQLLSTVFDRGLPVTHDDPRHEDPVRAFMFSDIAAWLPDDLLMKVDKMSMAVSLEARAPFLDHVMAEFALGLPTSMKIRGKTNKWILREAARGIVPKEIFEREKHGFDLPIDVWLRTDLRPLLEDLLGTDGLAKRDLFPATEISLLKREHLDGTRDHWQKLWSLMCLEQWCRLFLDAPTS
jgi:asparagine synthase (glutamine-hydrolysing)